MNFDELVAIEKVAGKSVTEAILAAAQKIAEEKEKELLGVTLDIPVNVEILPLDEIVKRVTEEKTKWGIPPRHVPNRWIVNYIRHKLTSYDTIIEEELRGKVGREKAYGLLRERVLEEIGKAYPRLKYEAQKQIQAERNPRKISNL